MTLGITRNAYDKIVAELDACRRKIIEIATAEDETDEVYRLNLQFFPMTNKQSLNKKGYRRRREIGYDPAFGS